MVNGKVARLSPNERGVFVFDACDATCGVNC